MRRKSPWLKDRITLSIILPVSLVGLVISILSITLSTPPLISFIKNRTQEELRLASNLGLSICEERLNQLLELRLENDPEMVASLRSESIKEIEQISEKFHKIHLLIVEKEDLVAGSSAPFHGRRVSWPLSRQESDVQPAVFFEEPVRMHYRYFPLWRWHIIAFMYEKDYMEPLLMAKRILYVGAFGFLFAMVLTILWVFNRRVNIPPQEDHSGHRSNPRGSVYHPQHAPSG